MPKELASPNQRFRITFLILCQMEFEPNTIKNVDFLIVLNCVG